MPLMPKRVKHRKQQRGNRSGIAQKGQNMAFGDYGMKSMGRARVKATEIEACRITINRHMKRKGKLWIRIFPDKPITKKPIETRMGKGKGTPEYWVAVVKPGRMLFEIAGVTEKIAREAFRLADAKLRIRTRFITRGHQI